MQRYTEAEEQGTGNDCRCSEEQILIISAFDQAWCFQKQLFLLEQNNIEAI